MAEAKAIAALRPDGEVRGLRLQQVARRRVRARRLPDRVFQGASPVRVHGGEPVARHGRHRQGAQLPRRRDRASASTILPPDVNASNYRFEPVDAKQHPLRPRRRQGHGRGRDRSHRRRARRRRARSPTSSTSAAASTSAPSTAARSKRWCAPARSTRSRPRRAALLASVGIALDAAERAQASAAQVSLFGEDIAGPAVSLVATREWTEAERLQNEKSAIGYYLSGHPYAAYAAELALDHAHDACEPGPAPGASCWSPAS